MELRILEFFAAVFLFLHIIRPLVRGLWSLDGLAACPLLALGILAGIFPAYGFRPECLPLLFFAIFITFAHSPDFLALFSGLQSDSYRDRSLLFTFASAAVFVGTLWITLYFAPPVNMDLSTGGVETLLLRDRGRDVSLHIRIYGDAAPADGSPAPAGEAPFPADPPAVGRPLLVLIPPVAGSLSAADAVCTALRDRGFTVISYSRPGFDSPAFDGEGMPVRLFIPGLYRLANAVTRGLRDEAANADGRELEEGRRLDTEFLLQELVQNKTFQDKIPGTDRNTVFLAGYGAGGAALTVLAGRKEFLEKYGQIRGIIAVEAPLLSSLEGDPRPPPPPLPANPVGAFFRKAELFGEGFVPRKITHVGYIPQPELPMLFILSDRVIRQRSGRYETVLRALNASRNTALLAAVPGAGPFDYSGSPRYYPIFSFLFRGHEAPFSPAGPELTASLMTNFALFVLENGAYGEASGTPASGDRVLPSTGLKRSSLGTIHLETGGIWPIPAGQAILQGAE